MEMTPIEKMVFADSTSLQAHIIELESTKAIGIFPSGYDAPPAQDGQASTFAATGATGGGGGHAQSTGPAPSPQQVTPSTTTPPSGKGKGKGKGKEHAGSTAPSSQGSAAALPSTALLPEDALRTVQDFLTSKGIQHSQFFKHFKRHNRTVLKATSPTDIVFVEVDGLTSYHRRCLSCLKNVALRFYEDFPQLASKAPKGPQASSASSKSTNQRSGTFVAASGQPTATTSPPFMPPPAPAVPGPSPPGVPMPPSVYLGPAGMPPGMHPGMSPGMPPYGMVPGFPPGFPPYGYPGPGAGTFFAVPPHLPSQHGNLTPRSLSPEPSPARSHMPGSFPALGYQPFPGASGGGAFMGASGGGGQPPMQPPMSKKDMRRLEAQHVRDIQRQSFAPGGWDLSGPGVHQGPYGPPGR